MSLRSIEITGMLFYLFAFGLLVSLNAEAPFHLIYVCLITGSSCLFYFENAYDSHKWRLFHSSVFFASLGGLFNLFYG